jgi:hypothetical protein
VGYLTDDQRRDKIEERASVVRDWLVWLQEMYAETISRQEEMRGSESGFDPQPHRIACRHPRKAKKGKLCMACDNTGWREATAQEKNEGMALDPYAGDLPKKRTAMILSDELSETQLLDATIANLDRLVRVRDGEDILEDRALMQYRIVSQKPPSAVRVISAMNRIKHYGFDNFLDLHEVCVMAALLTGPLRAPPARVVG